MTAAARRERLGSALAAADLEAMLVTNLADVRWLTGFTGSNGAVLVRADGDCVFATDGRYIDQAAAEVPDLTHVIDRATTAALLRLVGTAAVDPANTTLAQWDAFCESGAEILRAPDLLSELRQVKDPDEVRALELACRITDEAIRHTWSLTRPGMTERDVRRILEAAMVDAGAEVGFPSIVATGANSAIPHHQPGDTRLEPGDILKIDCGARINGYHADETRVAVVAAEPEAWQTEIHAIVLEAQSAGIAALHAGASCSDVDRAARSVVEEAGFGERFTHGLGHGVGLDIHERPFVGDRSADRILLGAPVTIEPGVYLPGRGGIRIEDTLLVGQSGATPLTLTDRGLRVVG